MYNVGSLCDEEVPVIGLQAGGNSVFGLELLLSGTSEVVSSLKLLKDA
jgi:hypothetical protein